MALQLYIGLHQLHASNIVTALIESTNASTSKSSSEHVGLVIVNTWAHQKTNDDSSDICHDKIYNSRIEESLL